MLIMFVLKTKHKTKHNTKHEQLNLYDYMIYSYSTWITSIKNRSLVKQVYNRQLYLYTNKLFDKLVYII